MPATRTPARRGLSLPSRSAAIALIGCLGFYVAGPAVGTVPAVAHEGTLTPPKPTEGTAPNSPPTPPATQPAESPATTTPARVVAPADRTLAVTLREWTKTRATTSPKDDPDQVALGRLMFSVVDVECINAKVGESVRALADALGCNLVIKFDVAFVDDTPVDLSLKRVSGITALEAIIAQGGASATWQLRRGIVEVGSKLFLARATARRTETYDVTSIVFDVPYTPSGSIEPPNFSAPGARNQTMRPFKTLQPDPEAYRRKAPVELAADLMQVITDQVEPEAWQPIPEGDGSEGTSGPAPKLPTQGGTSNHGMRNQSTLADRNFDASIGPPFVRGKWGSMSYYKQGGHLIVAAPDFVHRGIGGYEPPLPVAVGE